MWANAQRDGHPAEYSWRPVFNAALWLTPTTRMPCSNAAKTRNPLKFAGVPQSNETISAASAWAPAREGQGGQPPTLEKIRVGHAHPGNINRGLKTFRQ